MIQERGIPINQPGWNGMRDLFHSNGMAGFASIQSGQIHVINLWDPVGLSNRAVHRRKPWLGEAPWGFPRRAKLTYSLRWIR